MTTQFQPGDRVRCIREAIDGNYHYGLPGAIYTVKSHDEADITAYGGVLRVEEINYRLSGNRFTLHAKAGEFAVGDKVVYTGEPGEFLPGQVLTACEEAFDVGLANVVWARTIDGRGPFWERSKNFRLATPDEIAAFERTATSPAAPPSISCDGVDYFPHSLELRTAIANVEAGVAELKRLLAR